MRALRYLFKVVVITAIIATILIGGSLALGATLGPSWAGNWFAGLATWLLYDKLRKHIFQRRSEIHIQGKLLNPNKRYRFKDWTPGWSN